jgi:nucleoside-diphosphate-sugar epimerase
MNSTKKVLLTGGAGYIGSHTAVELIQQGFDIVVIDDFSRSEKRMIDGIEKITNQKLIYYQGDCGDLKFLDFVFEKEKIESVIHFAAYKSVNLLPEQHWLHGFFVEHYGKAWGNRINFFIFLHCLWTTRPSRGR